MSLWLPPGEELAPARTGSDRGQDPPPALFVDRDGCVIEDRHYLCEPDEVALLPGAAAALRRARKAGWLVLAVSNQSGIGRGRFSAADLDRVMQELHRQLMSEGTRFDGFFYCPHDPDAACACRKPRTGLLIEAARYFRWQPTDSWVIGDKLSDVDLARAAGLGGILVRTGYGEEQARRLAHRRRWRKLRVARDLAAAVDRLLSEQTP